MRIRIFDRQVREELVAILGPLPETEQMQPRLQHRDAVCLAKLAVPRLDVEEMIQHRVDAPAEEVRGTITSHMHRKRPKIHALAAAAAASHTNPGTKLQPQVLKGFRVASANVVNQVKQMVRPDDGQLDPIKVIFAVFAFSFSSVFAFFFAAGFACSFAFVFALSFAWYFRKLHPCGQAGLGWGHNH